MALLGVAYIVLIQYFTGHTLTWGDPAFWYDFWGENTYAAISWIHIFHSLGVFFAAVPVAIVIIWRYKTDWFHPTLMIAALSSVYVLFDQLRGVWILRSQDVPLQFFYVVSGAIDVIKVGAILVLVATLTRVVLPSNNALH